MSIEMTPARERLLLWALMALQFTMIVDFMIIMPLSSELMNAFDISTAKFGLLVSAYSISAGISLLIASSLADRFDRRQSLLFVYVGLLVATLCCAFANTYELLLAARVAAGFFGGLVSSIVLAIVGDVFPLQKRGRAMGIVMLGFSLAAIAGVPLGLYIANCFSWQTPFISISVSGIAILVLTYFVVPPIREHLNQPKVNFFKSYVELFNHENHLWAFVVSGLVMIAGFLVIPYIAPTMISNVQMSNDSLPYIYFAGGLATLFSRPVIGRLTDKYKHAYVLAGTSVLSFIPVILVTQTLNTSFAWQLVFATLFFVFVSGRFIPTSALITASCEPRFRGRVMAFSSAVQNLGSGVAVFVAGVIMTKTPEGIILHYDWVGYISCAVAVVAVWAAMRVKVVS